jgi:hypothetical protein
MRYYLVRIFFGYLDRSIGRVVIYYDDFIRPFDALKAALQNSFFVPGQYNYGDLLPH